MAMLSQEYQAKVVSPNSALLGVAQIRIGRPSMRSVSSMVDGTTAASTFSNTQFNAACHSTVKKDATDNSTYFVVPSYPSKSNTGTGFPIANGTYTGTVDGCIILRVTGPTAGVIYDTMGGTTVLTSLASIKDSTPVTPVSPEVQGITISGSLTNVVVGDTWVLPVYASVTNLQQSKQTNIVTPFSMFSGAANSVGGLKSASFNVKFDKMATMESGIPSSVDDQVVLKSTASIKFSAMEFTNPNVMWLREMAYRTANSGEVSAIAAEVIVRTRGGELVSYWCPNCTLASSPDINPTNDFSEVSFELTVGLPSPAQASGTHAAWLRNQSLYSEATYIH